MIRTFSDPEALAQGVARAFLDRVGEIQAEGPERVARVVLTGGTIADAVHRQVAAAAGDPAGTPPGVDEPRGERAQIDGARIDWARIDWWWGDERFVPLDSPDRNAGQARRALLDHVAVDERRVHEIPSAPASSAGSAPSPDASPSGSSSAALSAAAAGYAAELADALGAEPFDLVMLGIGPDGHVASLFPQHAALAAVGDTVAVPDSPKPPPERLSLTFSRLNNAHQVWILASGESKREAVEALLAAEDAPGATVQATPARAVHGLSPTSLTLWTDLPLHR